MTMTRDRGAVIDTVREGGIVVIIRNMSRHIGNDTGGDDDIQSDLQTLLSWTPINGVWLKCLPLLEKTASHSLESASPIPAQRRS